MEERPMPYSIEQDLKLIKIQNHIDRLLIMLQEHLKDANPIQVKHIKRELNNLITQRFNEIKT